MSISRFEELVASFARLPGVGKKSAQKYAYFVALGDPFFGQNLAHQIEEAVRFLHSCERCGFIAEGEICEICADELRNHDLLCVVESAKDIITIENSRSYDGLYFVLKSTDELFNLQRAIEQNGSKELIFALTPGPASDAVMLLVENELSAKLPELKFSKIAQGVPTGVSLENIDLLSLSKALKDRNNI